MEGLYRPCDASTMLSLPWKRLLICHNSTAQCPSQDCEGARAFYYQVQIRSADEPMTTFLKVRAHPSRSPSVVR